jgi:hypothetical protein
MDKKREQNAPNFLTFCLFILSTFARSSVPPHDFKPATQQGFTVSMYLLVVAQRARTGGAALLSN